MSVMRRLTFFFCSRKSRSRSLRDVTKSPSRPAQGELFALKIIAIVGSSIRSAGSALGCFQCARMCPWDAKLGEGEFKGTVVHFNAGGEWLDTFFNLGIKGNAELYLAEKINNLGIN